MPSVLAEEVRRLLLPKQQVFYDSNAPHAAFVGLKGCGKTTGGAAAVSRQVGLYKANGLLLAPNRQLLEDNLCLLQKFLAKDGLLSTLHGNTALHVNDGDTAIYGYVPRRGAPPAEGWQWFWWDEPQPESWPAITRETFDALVVHGQCVRSFHSWITGSYDLLPWISDLPIHYKVWNAYVFEKDAQ